jgi:nucleoid-associated protein YgaU
MAAVAHASPAGIRRLSFVGTGPSVRPVPARLPTTVYRRRQAAALVVVLTALAVLALAVHGLLVPSGGGPLTASGRGTSVYVVQPGDTFWDIARRLQPGGDPRPLVAELVAAHGSPVLVAGERIQLPDRS